MSLTEELIALNNVTSVLINKNYQDEYHLPEILGLKPSPIQQVQDRLF